ncbi:protein kinase domain-containing protein [Planosporangium sp. 12N6]|uniref:serine/threonine-protein kinase n=1 Tax=Planosporangium spinosum TaxID=3402278 RepID=UPI003CF759F3
MVSPGTMLGGRYRLDERIAGGGMGEVWRATDEVLGRTVAVKVLLPALVEEPGFAERFRGEARTMATLNHPGVVDVYDYGSEDGTAFLVMEYVEGDALSATLARVHRLTPARTMALIAQAADALHAAHANGIVHRDVKPGNLLVRPNGTLVLTDFGIARAAGGAQLTQAGSVLGTASYLAPEQAAGRTATPLSDVYALGVVAYQCLAGRRPFEGDNPIEIAMRHVRDVPPPLPGDIPPVVRQVVERAMAKDPGARFPSAAAMAQVARHAAQLAATGGAAGVMPTSGGPAGPTRPVSAAPVSPPLAGATARVMSGPPAPGGTRVMPGAAYPAPGAQPATGGMNAPAQRPGQYVRGAAAVPPPAPAPATDYTRAASAPSAAPGGAGVPASGGGVARWIVLALVIVLLFCAGGWLLLRKDNAGSDVAGGPSSTPATTTTTQAATPTPKATRPKPTTEAPQAQIPQTPKSHIIDCAKFKNKDADDVRKSLDDDNFTVKVAEDTPNGRKGRVAEVAPCGEQPEETEVTVHVFTGEVAKTPGSGGGCNPTDPGTFASCPPQQR